MLLPRLQMPWYRHDPRAVADEREVAAIVHQAWITNVVDSKEWADMGFSRPWARAGFTHYASVYVRQYFAEHGVYPTGYHVINQRSGRAVLFGVKARLRAVPASNAECLEAAGQD